MTTKKVSSALEALKKVEISQPSQTALETLPPAKSAKSTKARRGAKAPETVLSKPTALNLYPEDQDKIEQTISYLRSKGCQGVSKSRIGQLALRELKLDEKTVAAFKKLPDYRDKKGMA